MLSRQKRDVEFLKGQKMKLERAIAVQESEATLQSRAVAYLEQAGYKQVSLRPSITFCRGSAFGSRTSFSPRGWQVQTTVRILPSDQTHNVSIKFDINSTGQLVTEKERSFWESELNELETSIRGGYIDLAGSTGQSQSSLHQNLKAVAVIIGLALVFGITALAVLGTRLGVEIGVALGFVIGYFIAKPWLKF
jgi:hypothetical protein